MPVQEIDSLLAGGLTADDEDDVLQELEQIIKVYFMCIQLFTKDCLCLGSSVCLC